MRKGAKQRLSKIQKAILYDLYHYPNYKSAKYRDHRARIMRRIAMMRGDYAKGRCGGFVHDKFRISFHGSIDNLIEKGLIVYEKGYTRIRGYPWIILTAEGKKVAKKVQPSQFKDAFEQKKEKEKKERRGWEDLLPPRLKAMLLRIRQGGDYWREVLSDDPVR